jgi:FimV-like protein
VTILDEVLMEESPPVLAQELRAVLARRMNDHLLAETLLQKLIEFYPNHTEYQSDLLEVSEKLGRDDQGLAPLLRRVASQQTDNGAVRKRLARLAVAEKNWTDAVRWAEEAIQIDVLDAAMHRILAEHGEQAGDRARALLSWQALVDLDQASVEDRLTLARMYVKSGQKDSAKGVLRKILEEDEENSEARTMFKQLDGGS